ncbi:methyltransferase domain-containing protein [Pseudoxanthomonas wuyuanensis]|uniref:methyltransferase domain-containing protein n=1 Tax=Pseudoxanthomonas wuyuanensis TaxID=1073196 RepID=UPI00138A5AEF|nr:methyltransferase domain-containing protein [Pseudoxanthomonas wuyuanensis]
MRSLIDGYSGAPLLVEEQKVPGRHWLNTKLSMSFRKDERLEIFFALRQMDSARIRIRLDLAGTTRNGLIDMATAEVLSSEFTAFEVQRARDGAIWVTATIGVPTDIAYLNVGLMLESAHGEYEYLGGGTAFVIEALEIRNTGVMYSDPSVHSRHEPFGRAAHHLCKGKGLEVGALHRPFDLDAHVTYLDYEKTASLRKDYKADPRVGDIRQVQVVWKENNYPFFDDDAFDFVINSHVLEHVCNPGRAIEEWLRIIGPGGVLYMVVPDKNYTFDKPREITPLEHLMEEFHAKTQLIARAHYEDYVRNREGGKTGKDAEAAIEAAFKRQSSIHVHTFTKDSLREFLETLMRHLNFKIEHFEAENMHIHVALRKLSDQSLSTH